MIKDIAGIEDELVIDMGVVNIETSSKGIYGYYNGSISYKDQVMTHDYEKYSYNILENRGI